MAVTSANVTKKMWWEPYRHLIPSSLLDYIIEEANASNIDMFEPVHIPGILQTESYARMALTQAGMYQFDAKGVDERVKLRMQRQWQIMDKGDPPQITVILDEAALHRHAHSAETLREQLLHIAELAELPMVTIRVLPFSAGLHAGMDAGGFTILSSIGEKRKERLFSGEYLQATTNQVEVFMFKQTFEGLLNQSLRPSESLNLIRAIAQDL